MLNGLQKTQMDALQLLSNERAHHALSYRSIAQLEHYAQLLRFAIPKLTEAMSVEEKSAFAEGMEFIPHTIEQGQKESADGFRSVIRRTTIVLSDIIENLVEATIGTCLLHLDPEIATIRHVTKFKRQALNERLLRQAVRAWESDLFIKLPRRTDRFSKMLASFFPSFIEPDGFDFLNELMQARNEFSHELITVQDHPSPLLGASWTLSSIDQAFDVANDFLLAIMKAVPGDYEGPVPVFGLDLPTL